MESERDRKIRERAYELWVQGGRTESSSEQDWLQAEQEYAAGSESPDVSASAGSSTAPAKRTTRARSTSSDSKAEKSTATRTGAKRQAKSGAKSDAGKPISQQR